MTKFCPYCGKQLSTRSKFCPQCGKAAPQREQSAVAIDEANAPPIGAATGGAETAVRSARTTTSREGNGAKAVRPIVGQRYAPPTYVLIGSYESAGFGLRYGAWMFDFLISLIAIMVFTFAVTAVSHYSVVNSNKGLLLVGGLTALLFLLNFVVLAGLGGQSAGMRILGIYILRVDGKPFTIKDAAMRHLVGYPLSTLAFFLGFLWMLWDPRQQGWHDKIARTIVVMSK